MDTLRFFLRAACNSSILNAYPLSQNFPEKAYSEKWQNNSAIIEHKSISPYIPSPSLLNRAQTTITKYAVTGADNIRPEIYLGNINARLCVYVSFNTGLHMLGYIWVHIFRISGSNSDYRL
jgi:hypothetical protein